MPSVSPAFISAHQEGYWGHVSSTVDWCERNYEYSFYIAELFNSVSSLSMITVGALGVLLHFKHVEWRFIFAFLSIVVIGFGSIAFHGTLLFELQMWDEIPMLFAALILTFIQIEMNSIGGPKYPTLPYLLAIHGSVATLLTLSPIVFPPEYTSPLLQFFAFHISFKTLEVFNLYNASRLYITEKNPNMKQLHTTGMCLYICGIVFWLIDWFGCDSIWEGESSWRLNNSLNLSLPLLDLNTIGVSWINVDLKFPNLQGHAFWHVFVSSGLYLLILGLVQRRSRILGNPVSVQYFLKYIPYIKTTFNSSQSKAKSDEDIQDSITDLKIDYKSSEFKFGFPSDIPVIQQRNL